MFDDESPLPDLKPKRSAPFNWKSLPVDLLIEYRQQIDAHLPPLNLREMNMEQEMLLQYHSLKALQVQVLNDTEIPLNQRAQVANTVATNILRLAEMQTELFTSERLKLVEKLLIQTLNSLPTASAEAFLTEYRQKLLNNSKI